MTPRRNFRGKITPSKPPYLNKISALFLQEATGQVGHGTYLSMRREYQLTGDPPHKDTLIVVITRIIQHLRDDHQYCSWLLSLLRFLPPAWVSESLG